MSKVDERGEKNLVIRLPEDMMDRLNAHLPFGTRSEIIRNFIKEFLIVLDSENKELFLGAFIAGRIGFMVKERKKE